MISWKESVQAQCYFAEQCLESLLKASEEGSPQLDQKKAVHMTMLSFRHLWHSWLNEWSGYLAPKGEKRVIVSWLEMKEIYADAPGIIRLNQDASSNQSWAAGWIELEKLDARSWLSIDPTVDTSREEEQGGSANSLQLKQIEVRPLSASNGSADLKAMLASLKDFINDERFQHSEW